MRQRLEVRPFASMSCSREGALQAKFLPISATRLIPVSWPPCRALALGNWRWTPIPSPPNKTKRQRSEVWVGLLRVVEGRARIRTARAQSWVCLVISRGPWFGEVEHGRQKMCWRAEPRTIIAWCFLFHPSSRHLSLSRVVLRGLAVEAEGPHPGVHAEV